MRIATWNVNSIRARAERVSAWLQRADVDVLAMQETKTKDEAFPYLAFEAYGYEVAHVGTSQWNGVAIASRVGLDDVARGFDGQPGWGEDAAIEARALGATCDGVRVWSVYVPNGRARDDPHYLYKLHWLRALRDAAATWPASATVVLGDWNVAPNDEDVWSTAYYAGRTHTSDAERAALVALGEVGLREVTSDLTPGRFTYWDYQQLAFPKNRGMRIDLAFANAAAVERLQAVSIDREERKGKGASDHVPVVLDLAD